MGAGGGRCYWHLEDKGRDADEHPITLRTAPPAPSQKVNSAEASNWSGGAYSCIWLMQGLSDILGRRAFLCLHAPHGGLTYPRPFPAVASDVCRTSGITFSHNLKRGTKKVTCLFLSCLSVLEETLSRSQLATSHRSGKVTCPCLNQSLPRKTQLLGEVLEQ